MSQVEAFVWVVQGSCAMCGNELSDLDNVEDCSCTLSEEGTHCRGSTTDGSSLCATAMFQAVALLSCKRTAMLQCFSAGLEG